MKTFKSVASLKLASLQSGQRVSTRSYYEQDIAQGGAEYDILTLQEVRDAKGDPAWVPDGYFNLTLANGNVCIFSRGSLFEDVTVTVPGQFNTLQAALDFASTLEVAQGVTYTISIDSGHELTAGYRVEACDLSFVSIQSVDPVVGISAAFVPVSNADLEPDVPRSTEIGFLHIKCSAPVWDVLVDCANKSLITGMEYDYTSSGVVRAGCGLTNVSGTSIRVTTNSRLQAAQSVFTNSGGGNVAVTLSSTANLQNAILSGAGTEACLDVSRGSYVHAKDADCSGGSSGGIYVRRATVSAQGANLANCASGVFCSQGARVSVLEAVFDGCTSNGQCNHGSYLDVSDATKSGVAVVPSDFTVPNQTGGTKTLDKFNAVSGGGVITNKAYTESQSEYLTAQDSLSVVSGSSINIPSLSFSTILDITSGGATVFSGAIYGMDTGVRVTVDGAVVLNDQSRAIGDDSAGNGISTVCIPPIRAKDTLKIEAYNRASIAADFGFKIYRK